ncbi:MAG: lipopolysaccharide biosynthesis protein, partial [Bacteroidetes bacterium]|nr:lipopolysaccharide biosynthesis protein [Bacteroidota bacterium]
MHEENQEEEVSIQELVEQGKEWANYLLSQWKIFILAILLGGILGLLYASIRKPIYTASLSFVLEGEQEGGGMGGALGLASSFGINVGSGGSVFSGSNLTQLFKSRVMVEKTLLSAVVVDKKKISLAEMFIQGQGWRKKWDKNAKLNKVFFEPGSNRENFARVQDSILGSIYYNLSSNSLFVEQKDKNTSIINIDVLSTDETFSKYFLEALVKKVSDFYIDTKIKKSRQNMLILSKQTDS